MEEVHEDSMNDEIAELKADVARLEEALKDQTKLNSLFRAWKDYQNGGFADEGEEICRAKLESLKNQADLIATITDIVFTDVNTNIVSQEKLKVVKKQEVNGYCGSVEFQLRMEVEESMDMDSSVRSTVTHLSISASESVYRDLKDVVERLAEAGDVQGFLSLLRPYSIWQAAREKVYTHFVTAYPNMVTRKNLQTVVLTHPLKNCSFEIVWHFKIMDLYTVVPDLQMTVHVPQKVQSSSLDFLKTIPEKFHLMLSQVGVEKTLNCLVAILAK